MANTLRISALEEALLEAAKDEPSAAELERYRHLFQQVNKQTSSLLAQVTEWLQAQLVWDSRDEPLLQGMRSADQSSYRLRYSAGHATIELAVESDGRLRHIEGELYAEEDNLNDLLLDAGPALITLLQQGEIVSETTTDLDGRFGFSALQAADYAMILFLGNDLRIELGAVNVL